MKRHRLLLPINVALAVAVVGVLLGCGGDSAQPASGSTEEKLNGEWESETELPQTSGETRGRTLSFRYLEHCGPNGGPGFIIDYREEVRKPLTRASEATTVFHQLRPVSVEGLTATVGNSRTDDGSDWMFRLDSELPGVLYVTWTQKDGTKQLDGVKFHKK